MRRAETLERGRAQRLDRNNALVGAGGLIWEHTRRDWEWVIGVMTVGHVEPRLQHVGAEIADLVGRALEDFRIAIGRP